MPAGSEPPGRSAPLPGLPLRMRPMGVRVASIGFAVALLVTLGAIWFAFPDGVREQFTPFQKLTVLGMLLAAFVVGHALSRCRVDADEEGLTVVNGYTTHRLDWNQVVAVTLRPGNPWALLDLSDGTTRSAMGIQGSDGKRAQRQVRQLRALVEAHAGSEPRD
ncbi:MAG TPA: PH domain-containing protein [Marmoricola sp.]|nr:PH domain-containing protein [Marmoricola sp.]